jgi:asparagine synthetase B (glutamine-hydrolysing)
VDVEGGHQPFLNEERSVVAIQNGELYNHADLRRELQHQGHVFASRCDTEILPHLYERDGARFPEQLRGRFGIAVSPLVGVRKLALGSVLTIDAGEVREKPYWTYPEPNPDPQPRAIEEYADELLELLRAAVRDRLMSDVPLGAMLSGGLDSSLIVALMAETSSSPVNTFAVGFREDETGSWTSGPPYSSVPIARSLPRPGDADVEAPTVTTIV